METLTSCLSWLNDDPSGIRLSVHPWPPSRINFAGSNPQFYCHCGVEEQTSDPCRCLRFEGYSQHFLPSPVSSIIVGQEVENDVYFGQGGYAVL